MTIDYASLISNDQKKSIIEQRINQFATEAYQQTLNKQTCESIGDSNGIEEADKALKILEVAIKTHQEELKTLV